ncbi:hypothetical protein MPRG_21320 [Mycobacterium paragordonae]|uniref:Uncharacterized protein n=1 Tax=Mycobacterium paragordonae TaxID=1389713 RepID=A0ABQ1C3I4_9MYCO|nr:hypothetical protein MPRG_21320 [Mycobacterium paragordonae]
MWCHRAATRIPRHRQSDLLSRFADGEAIVVCCWSGRLRVGGRCGSATCSSEKPRAVEHAFFTRAQDQLEALTTLQAWEVVPTCTRRAGPGVVSDLPGAVNVASPMTALGYPAG